MPKVCKVCKQEKDENQYEKYTRRRTRRVVCYSCLYAERAAKFTSTPYRFITRMVSQLKSARRKQGLAFDLDDKQIHDLYDKQEGKCAVTGRLLTWQRNPDRRNDFNISLDRIDPKGQYEIENLRLVCKRVNLIKHNMTDEELVDWCKAILNILAPK